MQTVCRQTGSALTGRHSTSPGVKVDAQCVHVCLRDNGRKQACLLVEMRHRRFEYSDKSFIYYQSLLIIIFYPFLYIFVLSCSFKYVHKPQKNHNLLQNVTFSLFLPHYIYVTTKDKEVILSSVIYFNIFQACTLF